MLITTQKDQMGQSTTIINHVIFKIFIIQLFLDSDGNANFGSKFRPRPPSLFNGMTATYEENSSFEPRFGFGKPIRDNVTRDFRSAIPLRNYSVKNQNLNFRDKEKCNGFVNLENDITVEDEVKNDQENLRDNRFSRKRFIKYVVF